MKIIKKYNIQKDIDCENYIGFGNELVSVTAGKKSLKFEILCFKMICIKLYALMSL